MNKPKNRPTPAFPQTLVARNRQNLRFVTQLRWLGSACLVTMLGGCGDDFATSGTTTNDAPSFDPLPSETPNNPRPTPPSPVTPDEPETTGPSAPGDSSTVEADASVESPMLPPEGPGQMPGDKCGGDRQPCCEEAACKAGFSCVPEAPKPDEADAAATLVCQRDPEMPPAPDTDAAMPGPPEGPGADGDAAPPGPPHMPPAPDGDAGPPQPPHMPPAPDADGSAPPGPNPDAECGAVGQICCKGRGGRCDEGLDCVNPNGPELTDSECVTAQ